MSWMIGAMFMAASKKSRRKWLLILWLLIVAGLPVYYLRPDCDWYYARWGTPERIVKSRINFDNPLYERGEAVYTRVFVVHPSAESLECLRKDSFETKAQQNLLPLLLRYELPGPYRFWHWHVHGSVDYVECGNGLLLLRDYSRNKGGLFSSRMAFVEFSELWEQNPPHVVFFYLWGVLGFLLLCLTPFLLLIGGGLYLILRPICRCFLSK